MPGALQVVIVYNKSNVYGLAKDAQLLAESLPLAGRQGNGVRIGRVKVVDCREPPVPCDLCIHLEVPYAVWFPWARINAILINGEWWQDAWNAYSDNFDIALFRDKSTKNRLESFFRYSMLLKWAGSIKQLKELYSKALTPSHTSGFAWFLGGSTNKRAAAEAILPLWRSSYPNLSVFTSEPLSIQNLPSNITIRVGYLQQKEYTELSSNIAGRICISQAESYGYTVSEALEFGSFTILNTLPSYETNYSTIPYAHWIPTKTNEIGIAEFTNISEIQTNLDTAIDTFLKLNLEEVKYRHQTLFEEYRLAFLSNITEFLDEVREAFSNRESLPRHMPPLLNAQDCPPISVITLVHNRPKFIENAFLNLLHTDYPRDKIEWVVVDDSDPEYSASNKIIQFKDKFTPGIVTYIPLARKRSIGFKRNIGVEKAKHDILLMMDDDDHYPVTSFRRRVAWLLKARKPYECATCTTIAMYDLIKGVSAVNVPPYSLSIAERCSEATLTFTRSFWKERQFPDISIAEGEEFLKGRESKIVEMPPQQIIVALTHDKNTGNRTMPNAGNGCFWGFNRQLLEFLHGLVGIKVEEEK